MRSQHQAGRTALRCPGDATGAITARRIRITLAMLALLAGGASIAAAQSEVVEQGSHGAWRVADLWAGPTPYAQGHRGYGADSYDAAGPLENTLDGFHAAFTNGIRVVELDLQRTADGKVIVLHDDVLGGRCVGSMTYDEVLAIRPQVPLFRAMLNSDRHFGSLACTSGIIFAEIKPPIPACNDDTTTALGEATESALVAAVVADIRQAGMEEQVVINAGTPSILRQAALQAPEIERALSLNFLQLLPPAAIPGLTGLAVRPIPQRTDCGLDWWEVSNIVRLPTYYPSKAGDPPAFQRFIQTTLGCAQAKAVSIDKLLLESNPAAAPGIVAALHAYGLEVVVWTVDTKQEWDLMVASGVDGITTNNIAMGLAYQAPATCEVALRGTPRANGRAVIGAAAPELSLSLARTAFAGERSVAVEFALPDAGAAKLALVDVAGRLIDSREVGAFGAGRHVVSLGRNLPPGVYLVRLSHDRGQARMKATVVR